MKKWLMEVLGYNLIPEDDEGGAGTAPDGEGEEGNQEGDASAETKNTDETPEGSQKKQSDHVPYDRFKEKNDEAKRLTQEKSEIERSLVETKTRLDMMLEQQAAQRKPGADSDPLFKTEQEKVLRDRYLDPYVKQQVSPLEDKIKALEEKLIVADETTNLAKSLKGVQAVYPTLDEIDIQAIEDRYILDPKVDLNAYAKKLHERNQGKTRKWIDKKKVTANRTGKMPDGKPPASDNPNNKSKSWLTSLDNAGQAMRNSHKNVGNE